MSIEPINNLACPLDGDPLTPEGSSWRCPAGHNFDVARQGYLHLLPVQNKRSREPGDSKAMVAARRRFLSAGYYQPIADAVNKAVVADLPAGVATISCLDAGCGEGYYLRELAASGADIDLALMGLDISKWATLSAAKQDKRPRWVVGSNANLPVQSGTLDRLLCLFGFPVYREFERVLKPGGLLLQVDAGRDHLRELREILYPELKPEKPDVAGSLEGFSLLATETIRYPLVLDDAETIADLLAMTPHLYRASAQGRERAEALTSITVTVHAVLRCFSRDGNRPHTNPAD